jgi:hypothetical protein
MRKIALFFIFIAALIVLNLAPSRAANTLPPPEITGNFTKFAVAENGSTVAYAWASPRGGVMSVQGDVTIFTAFSRHTVNALAIALVDPNTPVIAWSDRAGIHSGIWQMGPLGFPAWFYFAHGAGRNPQLLTNPLRLIFFDKHGAFTCQQWSGTQWQSGCEA